MKSIWLFFILITCPAISKAQLSSADGTDCARHFFTALQEKDINALSNLLTTDFSVIGFNGQTITREQLIQAVSEGLIVVESGMLSGMNTKMFRDVAVVTGQWNIRARMQNNSYDGDLSYMAVCVRAGGKWQVSALQLTPLR